MNWCQVFGYSVWQWLVPYRPSSGEDARNRVLGGGTYYMPSEQRNALRAMLRHRRRQAKLTAAADEASDDDAENDDSHLMHAKLLP